MAILALVGLPGTGKSYGAVENYILPALEKGRRVTTNIPLDQERIDKEYPDKLSLFDSSDIEANPDWFQEVFEAGALLVIDEVWRLWPSGLKANQMHEQHKSFLAEHRHMVGDDNFSTEIVLIVQDLANIAAYPRSLVETTFRTVKLTAVGKENRFRTDIYEGAVSGSNPPSTKKLRSTHGSYKESVWSYYQSQTMSNSDGHGDETRTDGRANILSSPFFKFGLPGLFIFTVLVLFYGVGKVSDMYGGDSDQPQAIETPAPVTAQAPPPAPPQRHHFYDGKDVYISFNMGQYPRFTYHLTVTDGEFSASFTGRQLGKMGYKLIGYSECYVQLIGYGDQLDVFCQSESSSEDRPIIEL
jgi:zona occludens toxin